jgi:hypothetical protein
MANYGKWPKTPDAHLEPWVLWRFKNRPGPTPWPLPSGYALPGYAWQVLKWIEWKRKAHWVPQPLRPADVPPDIQQWGWLILHEVNRQVPKPAPPPPPPKPVPPPPPPVTDPIYGPNFYLKPGIMFYSAANTNVHMQPDEWARVAIDAGFVWFGFLVHEGARDVRSDARWRNDRLANELRARGGKICAWGSLFGEPGEGTIAAVTSRSYDGYQSNPEADYKYTDRNGNPNPVQFARAQRFAADFLDEGGAPVDRAISTLVGADIHMRPLIEAGFTVLQPQAYVNEFKDNTPMYAVIRGMGTVQHDFNGWPEERIAPTIASYGDFQKPVAEYAPLLKQAGKAKNWSHYTGEFMVRADFAAAKSLIKG